MSKGDSVAVPNANTVKCEHCSSAEADSLKMSEIECRSLQSSVNPKNMRETETEMPKATTS